MKNLVINNFILSDYIEDITICDDIIEWFENEAKTTDGCLTCNGENFYNYDRKKSTDAKLQDNKELCDRYFSQLKKITNKYIQEYHFCNENSAFAIIQSINVQKYKPAEGFFAWHSERASRFEPDSSRHLVFMTYLNDVTDGGETEFYYQQVKMKPKKGLTLIWPADWTHTHRGISSPTQEKYIVTGWYNYV